VRTSSELTRREPWREPGWRILMQALAAEGNTAEALQTYDRLRTLLRDCSASRRAHRRRSST
jgi:pentatricopeptide repeat protein